MQKLIAFLHTSNDNLKRDVTGLDVLIWSKEFEFKLHTYIHIFY